jgi:hypothetical protein
MDMISATLEVEVRRTVVEGQHRQKVLKTLSQQTIQAWSCTDIIPAIGEVNRGLWSHAQSKM